MRGDDLGLKLIRDELDSVVEYVVIDHGHPSAIRMEADVGAI